MSSFHALQEIFNSPGCQLKEDVLPAGSPWAYFPLPLYARETKPQFSLDFMLSSLCIHNDSTTET